MDKQSKIGFVLIGVVLIIWLVVYNPAPDPPPENERTIDSTLLNDTSQITDTTQPAEEYKPITDTDEVIQEIKSTDTTQIISDTLVADDKSEEIIRIENDVAIIEMTNAGGKPKKVYLKNFPTWYAKKLGDDAPYYRTMVELLNYEKGSSFDVAFRTEEGLDISTGALRFQADKNRNAYQLEKKDSIKLSYTVDFGEGRKLVKTFTFYGDRYDVGIDIDFVNMDKMVGNNQFDIIWNSGIRFVEYNSVDEANYANASVYYGDEQVKVDAASIGDEEPTIEKFNGRVEWFTIRNKYFAVVLAPNNTDNVEGAYIEGVSKPLEHNGIYEFYKARLEMVYQPGSKSSYNFMMYMGPVDYEILETYGETFTKVVDFGSFLGLTFIVRPIAEYILLPLFKFLHTFIPNYGFVIIVFSLIIKIVLFPLTKKSYQSMKRMQQLQPKIKELKEKYKDDQQKQNSETMKLYSKYGVNPAGGCLPLLMQMPIFVALWGLFQTAVELRQQPFILWIEDLSRPDIIYHLPFTIPFFGIDKIAGLALLMGVTTFFQQKMSVKDPSQKAMVYMMPVFLTVLFMSFPSGLNLYYFMFNVLSIGQQYLINKGKQEELKPVNKAGKKKGFFSRMMEEAEKKSKQQGGKR